MEETHRITHIEERTAFCERNLEALSDVVFRLQKQLQELELRNYQLVEEVKRLRELLREPFRPQDEKPPHY